MIVVKYYICIPETYPYTMQSDGVCYEFSTYIEDEDPAKLKRSKKRKQELFDAIQSTCNRSNPERVQTLLVVEVQRIR